MTSELILRNWKIASALANHVSASDLSYDPISKGRISAADTELETEGGDEGGEVGCEAAGEECPSRFILKEYT